MNLPQYDIITKINKIANDLVLNEGVSFTNELKEGYCSLIPSGDTQISSRILKSIRCKFKNIYIWINETNNNYTIDFTLKF